jgi:hypothetical protein
METFPRETMSPRALFCSGEYKKHYESWLDVIVALYDHKGKKFGNDKHFFMIQEH